MHIKKSIPLTSVDFFIVIGVICGVSLLFLVPTYESMFFREDMSAYSAREYANREAIKHGQLPLWNPFVSEPLLGNPQGLTLYPVSIAFRFLPIPIYMAAFGIFHTVLLFVALYMLLRHWDFSRLASFGAAGLVAFSSYVFVRHIVGHIGVTPVKAWSILTLLFYSKILYYHRFRDFVGVLICASMLILSAHTLHALIGLLLVGSYTVLYFVQNINSKSIFSLIKYTLMIAFCLFGLLSLQLLPSAEYLLTISRADGVSFETANSARITPFLSINMLYSVLPYNFSQFNIQESLMFTSIMMPAFILIAFLWSPKQYRILNRYAMAVTCVSIVIALGSTTPLFPFMHEFMPMLKAPGRFLHWLVLPFAVYTAITIDLLENHPQYHGRIIIIITFITLQVLVVLLIYLAQSLPQILLFSDLLLVLMLSISILVWGVVIFLRFRLNPRTWRGVFVFGLLISTSVHTLGLGPWFPEKPSNAKYIFDDTYFPCISNHVDSTAGRVFHDSKWMVRAALNTGLFSILNPELTFNPQWVNDLVTTRPDLLQLNYYIFDDEYSNDENLVLIETGCNLNLYLNNQHRFQRVTAVNQIIVKDDNQVLETISDPEFDPNTTVVVQKSDSLILDNFSFMKNKLNYEAEITEYTPNKISVHFSADSPSIVILADPYYPGWKAFIDGVEIDIMKVNHGLRGMVLDAGNHNIEMIYSPNIVWGGLLISLATVLLIVALYFAKGFRRYIGLM